MYMMLNTGDELVEAAPTKVFQHESLHGTLLAYTDANGTRKYTIILSEVSLAPAIVQRTTASNLSVVLQRLSGVQLSKQQMRTRS